MGCYFKKIKNMKYIIVTETPEKVPFFLNRLQQLDTGMYSITVNYETYLRGHYVSPDAIFWLSDFQPLKEKDPIATLITIAKESFSLSVVAHALNARSNLIIGEDLKSLYDPLGNCFGINLKDDQMATALMVRINFLRSCVRIPSRTVDNLPSYSEVSEDFLSLMRELSDKFHSLIHSDITDRFLGCLSFRCESGFASYKDSNGIFISKRNIDKRSINQDSFVPILFDAPDHPLIRSTAILYKGDKPSVDAPLHLKLYDYYPSIRYIIHSHTYINPAFITKKVYPCGALNEFYDIVKIFPDRDLSSLVVNLKGHGSVCMSDNLDFIKNQSHVARALPEYCSL
jgi:ribulose-5-phosphate 4-epimerase/fuculose-1-phosphate aldolase